MSYIDTFYKEKIEYQRRHMEIVIAAEQERYKKEFIERVLAEKKLEESGVKVDFDNLVASQTTQD